jgi:hypothetical protein
LELLEEVFDFKVVPPTHLLRLALDRRSKEFEEFWKNPLQLFKIHFNKFIIFTSFQMIFCAVALVCRARKILAVSIRAKTWH